MATLFRNSSIVQLSLITNAFSRLRLQHAGSPTIPRHSTFSRAFTQTRASLLENVAGIDSSSTIDRDFSSPKATNNTARTPPPELAQSPLPKQILGTRKKIRSLRKLDPPSVKWTEEEDRELFRLVKEGKNTYYIYENHFRHRSHGAVAKRVSWALKAIRLLKQQASRGVLEGEADVATAAAGEEEVVPLRAVFAQFQKAERIRLLSNKSDDDDTQRADQLRKELFGKDPWRKGNWTFEEDELLVQLAQTFRDTPQPRLWHKVSGGKINESILFRSVPSCRRRWRQLFPPLSARNGPWTKEEERLLQEAISEQLEGKYQVAIDVLTGEYAIKGMSPGEWRPKLQQLPSQSNLPMLKDGSARLRMLNWIAIGEKVESRTDEECHDHFYEVYHNGRRGPWSKEEKDRFQESFDQLGEDHWKIAEHVGTRSPRQVYLLMRSLAKKRKTKSPVEEAAKEAAKEASFDKKK